MRKCSTCIQKGMQIHNHGGADKVAKHFFSCELTLWLHSTQGEQQILESDNRKTLSVLQGGDPL